MRPIEEIYKDLSNVDIRKARYSNDERSKGYRGEYTVFEHLYTKLPGNCKLLTNLQIPLPEGKSTEIDLLLIHETGIYVFEVKHYKGTIRGSSDDATWVQYFRTAPSHTFLSPVEQNRYHIRALSEILHQIPMYSFVVFTNSDCQLEVDNHDPSVNICKMDRLKQQLEQRFKYSQTSITAEQIDQVFRSLMPYSPMACEAVEVDGVELPFFDYAAELRADYQRHVLENQQETDALRSDYEKKLQDLQAKEASLQSDMDRKLANATRTLEAAFSVRKQILAAICIAVLILSGLFIRLIVSSSQQAIALAESDRDASVAAAEIDRDTKIAEANAALAAMEKNFTKVGPYNDGDLQLAADAASIKNVSLSISDSIDNCSVLNWQIHWSATEFGCSLLSDSKYIVLLQNGASLEINYWDTIPLAPPEYLQRLTITNAFGGLHTFSPVSIYNHTPEEIAYIKLTNVHLYKHLNVVETSEPLEFEIYNAETDAPQS